MRELRFICIEDDQLFMHKMIDSIKAYFQRKEFEVVFETYQDIPKYLNLKGIHACFFDIEINDKNTIDLIKDIRDREIGVPVIVVSQHKDYVFETVHLQIFDYIRKSRFDEEIEHALVRLQSKIHNTLTSVVFNYEGRIMEIQFSDILYIHIKSHHFVIHDIYGMEKEIWKNYDDIFVKNSTLIKVHKSYVINIHYCERINKNNAFLKGCDKAIPISTRNYNYVTTKFALKHSFIK